MQHIIFALLAVVEYVALANECTDRCDAAYQSGMNVTLCGTDLLDHHTNADAFPSDCYSTCGVMTYYPGLCGCPNDCFADLHRGRCSTSGTSRTCICKAGYSGRDCSLPTSVNTCSSHGTLLTPGETESIFDFDYCHCDTGWTGTDCSTVEFALGTVPWGTLIGNDSDVYTSKDKYGDNHPVWNISVLASIRVTLKEEDYLYLLQPWNLYNHSYKPGSVSFDNGHVQETFQNVGVRIKGQATRMDQKKGWNLKFDEFVPGQTLLDISKLQFKGGSVPDDTLLKTMVYSDMMRAMGVPVQRASYALLYINTIFVGIYYMHEEISPTFFDTRLKNDDGDGNTMKLYWSVNLQYFGDDETYYKEIAHVNALGIPMYNYEQTDGDGDLTGFIDWLDFLNNSDDEEFALKICGMVEIPSLLKNMVVESFMMAHDNLASGNNFYAYDLEGAKKWQIIEFDFDESFSYDPITHEPQENPNIIDFFIDENPSEWNPLLARLLTLEELKTMYLTYYRTFLNGVVGESSHQQPGKRLLELHNFIVSWMSQDKLWQLSYGMTVEAFTSYAMNPTYNFHLRYQDTLDQLNALATA